MASLKKKYREGQHCEFVMAFEVEDSAWRRRGQHKTGMIIIGFGRFSIMTDVVWFVYSFCMSSFKH